MTSHDYIKLEESTKTIEVIGAELDHFSRYGWTRTRN